MQNPARRLGLLICLLLALAAAPSFPGDTDMRESVRIGLTSVFLDDQATFLNLWREYLEKRLGRHVVFVQRGRYREITDLIKQDKLDFAWVCGYPYVRSKTQMKLLAVPVFKGKPLYRSYLIVPRTDTTTKSLLDLRGKIFAYSDPDSNSGYLFTQYSLYRVKEQANAFFRKTFFTWGHRKVVEAVAAGLAQGGAVDGYIWETLALLHPELTAQTRVVEQSPEFGFPPFVARSSISAPEFGRMQQVLTAMLNDPEGKQLLGRMNLEGFTAALPSLFDSIALMAHATQGS